MARTTTLVIIPAFEPTMTPPIMTLSPVSTRPRVLMLAKRSSHAVALQVVGLDQADAGSAVHPADDRGVVARSRVAIMADSLSSVGGMPVAMISASCVSRQLLLVTTVAVGVMQFESWDRPVDPPPRSRLTRVRSPARSLLLDQCR